MKPRDKKLKNYDEVITDDGTVTLYSKLYNEACHSTSGASEETRLHYIKGCKVEDFSSQNSTINIFEVGFGVGIGFIETLKVTAKNNCFLNFTSTEIDPELIEYILEKNNFDYTKTSDYYEVKEQRFRLIILAGDAREKIKLFDHVQAEKIDMIYQDAFSPKRNAILWTVEWFKDLKLIANSHCLMSTYSSSSSIRKSMIAAGWSVQKGEKFGPKRSSTRASLNNKTDQDILEHLNRSPAVTITDANFKEYTLGDTNEKNKNN